MPPRPMSSSLLAGLLLSSLAFAQAAATPPAPVDPKLPDQLKELRSMLVQPKMDEDFRAVDLIQTLTKDTDKRNPKDLDLIVKALGDVFRTGKVRPADRAHVYDEAAKQLGKLGADGARELVKAVTDNRLKGRDYSPVRAKLLTEVGHTKDEKQVDFLLEQALRSPDNDVMGAAGEALGNFTSLETKHRREVVKQLVSRYGEWHAKATQPVSSDPNAPVDFSPQNARETLNRIQGRWNSALSALTGQAFTSAPDWQRWINKNRDWVPPGGKK